MAEFGDTGMIIPPDAGVSVLVHRTLIVRLAAAEAALASHRAVEQFRARVRGSKLPAGARLYLHELACLAEERGQFRADHQTADVIKATGLSETSVRRHQNYIIAEGGFISVLNDGRGAGGVKQIELCIPNETVRQIDDGLRLIANKPVKMTD